VLPTFLAVSPLPTSSVALSLAGFLVFYTVLAVVDVYLLRKYIRLGPVAESTRPTAAPHLVTSRAL
jgi:cytochrome d ubiquinol oxidase subunit I